MIKGIKIRLKPTKEQETLMFKSCGISRFAFNWGLNKWKEIYKQGLNPNGMMIRKEFDKFKLKNGNEWIIEVSSKVTTQAFEDLQLAFNKFFKGTTKYPQFKSKRKSKLSFYVRYDAIKFINGKVNLEKIGKVEYKYNKNMPIIQKYMNPRCSYDGRYWYLSFGFEQSENQMELTDLSIGIDLGIKDLAIISNLDKPIKNINKSKEVKRLKNKLIRLQRQVSRKYNANKKGNKFVKTKNIEKLEKQIKLIHRRLTNIRKNHLHQATNLIVKTKPSRVVMENFNISGMMKNKHLSKAIQEQCFYEFIRQMKYKCEFNGIEFVQADRFYASSKTCSDCGYVKKNLKLKERTYICEECGLVIDRDKNASINLANYKNSIIGN